MPNVEFIVRYFNKYFSSFSGKKAELYDRNNPDWAPSLKLGPVEKDPATSLSTRKRYDRAQMRHRKQVTTKAAKQLDLQTESEQTESECGQTESDGQTCNFYLLAQLDMGTNKETEEEPEIVQNLRDEFQRLTSENMRLKDKLKETSFTPESFEKDEEKTKHYTGLNFKTLMAVFTFLAPFIPETSKSVLTKFEKVILVFLKLRLNLSMQDIGYRFNVSTSCVSKTFQDVIHVMFVRLKPLIMWPEREELRMSMPMDFRKYFGVKVSVIIDCFEIFIERPSNLLARAETWSNYKHHNTVKYLIGISPQGAVSFLSKGWGGRTTDKYLTENCGLLSKLLPGDIVLADRGFDIQESVGLSCAEVKIPAFTRGKKQLSPFEIEDTRKIAHTRIHVERVIGLVRNKYTILQSIIPVDYLHCNSDAIPTIDKITIVCCALSNLCESVVPFD
jgi:hypothetical protein